MLFQEKENEHRQNEKTEVEISTPKGNYFCVGRLACSGCFFARTRLLFRLLCGCFGVFLAGIGRGGGR